MISVFSLVEGSLEQVALSNEHDCWVWTGRINNRGYGQDGTGLAHRIVFEQLVADIPKGMTIDHLCRRKRCVNPHHLEVVTGGENARRVHSPVPYSFIGYEMRRQYSDADCAETMSRILSEIGILPRKGG